MNSTGVSKSYLNGLVAGLAQATIFHPIDLIRVRYFLRKDIGSYRTWFNGLSFNLGANSIKQMAVFPTHDLIKKRFQSEIVGSICSGALMGVISCPINSVRVPLQMSKNGKTTYQVVQQILHRHGIIGFYRGGSAIFLRDLCWASAYFPLYSTLQTRFNQSISSNLTQKNHSCAIKVGSSILAGVVGMMVAYPFDGSRLYRQHHFGEKDHTFWYGFRKSFSLSKSNIKSFTAGIIRVPLATTFSHMLYLKLQKEF